MPARSLKRYPLRTLGVLAAALAAVSGASAQLTAFASAKGVQVEALLEKLVESGAEGGAGRYELAPGVVAGAGEQFVLTLRFTNATGATVDGVRVTSAIPAQLRYVAGSATGPGGLVLFSVDGGRTFATEQELAAHPSEQNVYTHVRWVLDAPLEASATGFVRLRAMSR